MNTGLEGAKPIFLGCDFDNASRRRTRHLVLDNKENGIVIVGSYHIIVIGTNMPWIYFVIFTSPKNRTYM